MRHSEAAPRGEVKRSLKKKQSVVSNQPGVGETQPQRSQRNTEENITTKGTKEHEGGWPEKPIACDVSCKCFRSWDEPGRGRTGIAGIGWSQHIA
jgi:hypothetical protein